NLLSNAVKFTAHGHVLVRVAPAAEAGGDGDGGLIRFSVEDTGIGIAPHRIEHLFDSFTQIDASTTRQYGGTGLGLAICRRLAELMGGRIWAESEEGAGSTFSFTVRMPAAPGTVRVFLRPEQPLLEGRRVLIVDDNAVNRDILFRLATKWSMVPVAAPSGAEALAALDAAEAPFDVLLLDMQMPEMDGLMLARRIQKRPGPLPLMLLLTSINKEAHLLRESEAAGITNVLYKPLKPAHLHRALTAAFAPPSAVGTPAPAPAAPAAPAPAALRLLVVEDNVVNRKVAQRMIERLGYSADFACNGQEALDALARHPYDVVLMDVQMPVMDGLEATRRLRALLPPERRPRVVAMTASAMDDQRAACTEAGMDDFLSKPVQLAELAAVLEASARLAPPPAEAPAEALMQRLRARVGEVMGLADDAFATELLREFVATSPALLDRLADAADAGDGEAAADAAHTLKASCRIVAADALADACAEAEVHGRTASLDALAALAPTLRSQAAAFFSEARTALEAPQPGESS
ncbi:MAG: response regulator, partial [Rhodothermales bacterium]|nr:response regulator [Rhodothermales bacterium]